MTLNLGNKHRVFSTAKDEYLLSRYMYAQKPPHEVFRLARALYDRERASATYMDLKAACSGM